MTQRIASLVAQLVPGEKTFRLLPAGEFRSADGSGRPKDVPAWHIDAQTAIPVIARCLARQSRPVIDYEHQTLYTEKNGQPAPASGWVEALEWRDDGLYITADWTERAAAMIDAREYRYISPVFSYDKTGRVLDIKHVGLTNNPGLDGLTDLAALSAFFDLTPAKEKPMKKLLAALGLAEGVTEDEALAALAALNSGHETQVAALKSAAPDLAKFVPLATMTELHKQVATLTAQLNGKEVDDLVEVALSSGKLLPAQESWARGLGKSNLAALTSYLDTAQPIGALKGTQTGGKDPEGDGVVGDLSADELAVCKQLGVSAEDFTKNRLAAQA